MCKQEQMNSKCFQTKEVKELKLTCSKQVSSSYTPTPKIGLHIGSCTKWNKYWIIHGNSSTKSLRWEGETFCHMQQQS
jgi:hypothetical protein